MKTAVSKKTPHSASTSNLVRLWLKQKPFMHWLVREGLINYTSLARRLAKEGFASGKTPVAAIRAALLRARRLDLGAYQPFGANDVLKDSTFEIRSDVIVTRSDKALGIPVIAVSSSKNGITSVIDPDERARLPRFARIVGEGLVLLTIIGDERFETESGVLATLMLHLALQSVNVMEITSCGTDTLLVIEPKDLPQALSVLQALMAPGAKSGGARAMFNYERADFARAHKEGGARRR